MGMVRSRAAIKSSLVCFGIHGLSQNCMTRSVSGAGSNSHTVAAVNGCNNIPRTCGDGSGERDQLGIEGQIELRFVHPGSARICRSWKIAKILGLHARPSGALHHNALDNDAEGDIFPQRDQQLSRQGDYGRLLQTTAIAQDAFFKPQRQRRLRLVAKP
jgi:hypothetical protein